MMEKEIEKYYEIIEELEEEVRLNLVLQHPSVFPVIEHQSRTVITNTCVSRMYCILRFNPAGF